MFDLDASHRRFVREQGDFVSQDLGIAGLNKERREAGQVAKQGRDVGMGEVLVDRVAEEALDGVKVVVFCTRIWQVVERLFGDERTTQQAVPVDGSRRAASCITRFVSQLSQDLSRNIGARVSK